MIIYVEKEDYIEIYSDDNKMIIEFPNYHLWATSERYPIAIHPSRKDEYKETIYEVPSDAFNDFEENLM